MTSWLDRACIELNLQIDLGFVAKTRSGQIRADARIRNLGAVNGMLVFSNHRQIQEHQNELVADGYAFSVLDAPLTNEIFDLNSYIEMFCDWGWAGASTELPHWMDNGG